MLVYMILNEATEMSYIGKTEGTLAERWRGHKLDALNGSKSRFHAALREWGDGDVWTLVELQTCETQEELTVAEGNWIVYLDACNPNVGYNGTPPVRKNAFDEIMRWASSGKKNIGGKSIEFFRECGKKGGRTKGQMSAEEIERFREWGRLGTTGKKLR